MSLFIDVNNAKPNNLSLSAIVEQIINDKGNDFSLTADDYSLYELNSFDWEKILSQLAAIRPVSNENGVFSPLETYKSIKNGQNYNNLYGKDAKAAIRILAKCNSPSKLEKSWSRLMPLTMMAWKKYSNVGYELWDKEDKFIKAWLGDVLYDAIYIVPREHPEAYASAFADPGKFREALLTTNSGTLRKPTQYMGYNKTVYDYSWNSGNPVKYMIAQLWHAHFSNRNEYMILDPNNWDNIPEPLEELVDSNPMDDISDLW